MCRGDTVTYKLFQMTQKKILDVDRTYKMAYILTKWCVFCRFMCNRTSAALYQHLKASYQPSNSAQSFKKTKT